MDLDYLFNLTVTKTEWGATGVQMTPGKWNALYPTLQ